MRIHLLKRFLNESGKRRRKTGLITFALAWGSLSLLLLMSFGRGLSETFQESFKGLGDRLLIISGGQSSMVHQGLPKGRKISLYPEDVELIRAQAQGIRYISPESMTTLTLSYRGKETGRNVSGVYPEFANMRNQIPQEGGRFLNETDERERRRVVFLGWAVAENLFPDEEAVGKRVLINRVPFTVIGVMKKKLQTSSYEGTDAEMVYIPFSSYIQFQENRQIYMIHVEPESGGGAAGLEKKIKELLGRKYRFNPEDTYALNVWDTIEQAQEGAKVFMGIQIFLLLIGSLTLIIGAVGVTNLMYALVKERTREIGIKMALGAKRRHIVAQFLLETLLIFVRGTLWGGLVAFNIVGLVRLIPVDYDFTGVQSYLLRPVFSTDILVLFTVLMGVLVFFSGIFPALRASRLNPVDALRYE